MKLRSRNRYDTEEKRKQFATFLSLIISGHFNPHVPYKPMDHDHSFWTLDGGNNWKISFDEEDPHVFQIIYRYTCEQNQHEKHLVNWLKVKSPSLEVID